MVNRAQQSNVYEWKMNEKHPKTASVQKLVTKQFLQ